MNSTYDMYYYDITERPGNVSVEETSDGGSFESVIMVLFIMVITLVGNITLISILMCKKTRRIKRVNVFLVNLAVGDLAIACLTMTSETLFFAFQEWVLGPVICKLSVYLQIVTLASATFLLTGLSIDRYQVIVKPMKSLTQRPKLWRKVLIAWLLAFIFAVPQLFIFLQVESANKDGTLTKNCESAGYTKGAPWQRKVYFTYLTIYILIIPAIIMLYSYSKIIAVIFSRAKKEKHGAKVNSLESSTLPRMSVNRNLVSASKRRVVVMTLTVIIGLLVCLTPYFIVSLIRIYSDYQIRISGALAAAKIIFLTHSALNPILYGIFAVRWEKLKFERFCSRVKENSSKPTNDKTRQTSTKSCNKLRRRIKLLRSNNKKEASETLVDKGIPNREIKTRPDHARFTDMKNACNKNEFSCTNKNFMEEILNETIPYADDVEEVEYISTV